jgi:uncharacterized membrane protein
MDSPTFALLLGTATLTCALVTGLLGSFAVVVMPGLGTLDDRDYLQAFAVTDRVIQRNHPLFVLTWAGSVASLLAVTAVGIAGGDGSVPLLLGGATALYLLGVQAPTMLVNVPLNNRLQAADLEAAPRDVVDDLRTAFEGRWVRWNRVRSVAALVVVLLLLTTGHVA